MNAPQFKNKHGALFPGITKEVRTSMHTRLQEIGISRVQIVEAASYSFAMVVRYALGLSALDGKVCTLVGNSLASEVALATLRHLVNAGGTGMVLHVLPEDALSNELQLQMAPLKKMGVEFQLCPSPFLGSFSELFTSCHNVLCGLFEGGRDPLFDEHLVNALNELQTPIHAIECPLGIDPSTGSKEKSPLYASSTLSLGAPLSGLAAGYECVGRHYLCDISCTQDIYREIGSPLHSLFTEQPVIQIFPLTEEVQEG